MAERRYRILRLLKERSDAGRPEATFGEIAEALGETLAKVHDSLRASEGMGLVSVTRYLGTDPSNFRPRLKPGAYIHLESRAGAE